MLAASSAIDASLIVLRGWWGLGRMESIGINRGVPVEPATEAFFGLDADVGAVASGAISDSTGRFEIEIKLLKPRPRRGLFLVAVDMGRTPFLAGWSIGCSTWNIWLGNNSTIGVGKQQRPHGSAVGVRGWISFYYVSD